MHARCKHVVFVRRFVATLSLHYFFLPSALLFVYLPPSRVKLKQRASHNVCCAHHENQLDSIAVVMTMNRCLTEKGREKERRSVPTKDLNQHAFGCFHTAHNCRNIGKVYSRCRVRKLLLVYCINSFFLIFDIHHCFCAHRWPPLVINVIFVINGLQATIRASSRINAYVYECDLRIAFKCKCKRKGERKIKTFCLRKYTLVFASSRSLSIQKS